MQFEQHNDALLLGQSEKYIDYDTLLDYSNDPFWIVVTLFLL